MLSAWSAFKARWRKRYKMNGWSWVEGKVKRKLVSPHHSYAKQGGWLGNQQEMKRIEIIIEDYVVPSFLVTRWVVYTNQESITRLRKALLRCLEVVETVVCLSSNWWDDFWDVPARRVTLSGRQFAYVVLLWILIHTVPTWKNFTKNFLWKDLAFGSLWMDLCRC